MTRTIRSILAKMALVGALMLATPASATTGPEACGDKVAAPAKTVPADAAKLQFPIEGMTCGGCANTIQSALMAIDGVYAATVDHAKGSAVVSFDSAKVTAVTLTDAIKQAGYKPGAPAVPKA